MSVFEFAVKFFQDSGVAIYFSITIMAVGLAIAIERFIFLSRARAENRKLWAKVLPLLQSGRFKEVLSVSSSSDAAIGKIVANGLERMQSPARREDIDNAMEEGTGMTPAAWRAAFAAFLGFVKLNLAGQTGLRQEAIWGTQWSLVNGLAGFAPPDLLAREERLAEDLGFLAASVGVERPAPPATPGDAAPVPLHRVHDRDLEALARDVYRRDYMSFGFGAWKAPA